MKMSIVAVLLATAALPGVARAQSAGSDFTTATRYDAMHRVTGTISPDPDGLDPLHYAATRNTYDAAGRLTRVEAGELSAWQPENTAPLDWGSAFAVLRQVDTEYDGLDRKVVERMWSQGTLYGVAQYKYDPVGRLQCTAVRMNPAAFGSLPASACIQPTPQPGVPADRITRNVYDDAGQLVQVRKAVGTGLEQGYATYAYTPNGKRSVVIDANGNRAQMSYDGLDRLSRWQFPSAAVVTGFNDQTPELAWNTAGAVNAADYEESTYDAGGNRTGWRKRDGRTFTFAFDALDRVTSKAVPDGPAPDQRGPVPAASATRDVYYSYDIWGRQLQARFDSDTGIDRMESGYDGFGRQTASTTVMGGVTRSLAFQYDADGNRARVQHPDGAAFVYGYDGLNRLKTVTLENNGQVASLTYDREGRRANSIRGAVSTTYGYDPVDHSGRLHVLTDDLVGTAKDVTTTLDYNPAGQIVSRTTSNDAYAFNGLYNVNQGYATNGLNQYTAVGTAAPTYDANGNMIGNGTTTYGYDAENRLVSASTGATLTYDPTGRLWQVSGAGPATQFLYDGDQLTAEYGSAGNLLRRYVHGVGEDDPLLWYEGAGLGDRRSLQSDHQGSIVSVADAGGNALAVDTYDEYGKPSLGNLGRFQYTGQAWLPEVGLYHYKARVYSPQLGRFLQTDPVGYDDQVNLYAYVENDPVNKTDPTGTYECTGSKSQCGAVEGAYNRAAAALKSDNLSKADRTKLQGALSALGKPGQANGVNVGFASGNAIARATNGRSDIGYTEQGKNGAVNVRLNSNFGSLYDSYRGKMFGKDFSRLSARDERSGIFAHEGRHVYQFRNGMTPESYSRDVQRFERDAKDTGKLINKAYGSVSVYDTPED